MAAFARLGLLAIAALVVVLLMRDCVPSRVVFPSPSPTVSLPAPTRTATPLATATGSPAPSTFRLVVTDAELTQAAESSFPQTVSGVTVRDPVVRTTPSGVRLTATARVFFGTTEFVMTGTPYASAGRVAVRVDTITLGGFGLSESVRESSAKSVEDAIARLVPPTVEVERVSLGDGTVMIEGVARR